MMNTVRGYAFDTIQQVLNDGAYSNLKLTKSFLQMRFQQWIGIYIQNLFMELLKESIH